MSKSGYEIRSDILALAKEYLDQQTKLNMEYSKRMIEAGNNTLTQVVQNMPKPYTLDEMLDIAERMYTFVGKK
jgi:hypothetical protein